jgi:hypothetical protein
MVGLANSIGLGLTRNVVGGFRASASFSVADDFSTGVVGAIETSGAEGAVSLVGGAVTDQAGTNSGLFSITTGLEVTFNPQALGSGLTTDGDSTSTTYAIQLSDTVTTIDVTVRVTLTKPDQAPVAVGSISDRTLTLNVAASSRDLSSSITDADDTLAFTATGYPAGMSISSSGIESGTPTELVTGQVVTITATDIGGKTATSTFQITVEAAPVASLVLDDSNIEPPNAVSFRVTTDNTNDIYAVVTPSAEADPSEAQIIAGQNAAGSAATQSDVILSPSIGQVGLMLGDLDYRTSYKIHIAQNGEVVRSAALDLSTCTILIMLAGGQSNVQGLHALTGTGFPANNRGWNGTAWVALTGGNANPNSSTVGPPLGFAQAFAVDFPNIALYWVAASQTGTALSGISKGTTIFDDAVTDINAQLTALGSGAFFGGVIMHHGEANANPTGIVDYVTELPQYMTDVQTDITGADEFTPWIMGELAQDDALTANETSILATINNQRNSRLHTRVASSLGLATSDGTHFTEAAQITFGTDDYYPAYTAALLSNQYARPAAMVSGNWTVVAGTNAGEIDIAINTLPFDGNTDLTALQYSTDAGTTYATLLDGINTGTRTITTLSAGGAITSGQVFTSQIMVRAVNAEGNALNSDAKSVTASSGAVAWVPSDDYGTSAGEIWYHSDAASWTKDASAASVDGLIDTFGNSSTGSGWAPVEVSSDNSTVTRRQANGVDFALMLDDGDNSTFVNATEEEFIGREIWFLLRKDNGSASCKVLSSNDRSVFLSFDNVGRVRLGGKYGGVNSAAFLVAEDVWYTCRVQMRTDGLDIWLDGTSIVSETSAETTVPFQTFGSGATFGSDDWIGGLSEIISVEGTAGATLVTDLNAYLEGLRDTMNGP